MSFFCVLLLGEKICLKGEGDPIIGFCKARKVWAKNQDHAVKRAKKLVFKEWERGLYLEQNNGKYPELSVESVDEYFLWSGLIAKVPKKGFTFYSKE